MFERLWRLLPLLFLNCCACFACRCAQQLYTPLSIPVKQLRIFSSRSRFLYLKENIRIKIPFNKCRNVQIILLLSIIYINYLFGGSNLDPFLMFNWPVGVLIWLPMGVKFDSPYFSFLRYFLAVFFEMLSSLAKCFIVGWRGPVSLMLIKRHLSIGFRPFNSWRHHFCGIRTQKSDFGVYVAFFFIILMYPLESCTCFSWSFSKIIFSISS